MSSRSSLRKLEIASDEAECDDDDDGDDDGGGGGEAGAIHDALTARYHLSRRKLRKQSQNTVALFFVPSGFDAHPTEAP